MGLYLIACWFIFLFLTVFLEGKTFVDMLVKTFFIVMSLWTMMMLLTVIS